jgi:hypothetical protein
MINTWRIRFFIIDEENEVKEAGELSQRDMIC